MKPTFLRVGVPKSKTRAIGTVRPPTEAGQATLGGNTSGSWTDQTSQSFTLPSNMQVGDLVVVHITTESGPDPGPSVSGWTQQYSSDAGGGDYAYCYAKVVESGDIGGTFDFTGLAAGCDGAWIAYSISAGGSALTLSDLNLSGPVGMATAEHDPPSITPSQGAGDYIVIVVFHENKGGFITSWAADGPTGYDTLVEADEGGGTLSPAIHSWSNVVAVTTSEDPSEIGWSDSAGSRTYATATLAIPSVYGDPQVATGDHTHTETDVTDLTHHVIVGGFGEDNLAASLTDSQLYRQVQASQQQTPVVMPYAGSVLGISVASSEARTAGTATFEVFKNGTATGLTTVLDATDTQYAYNTQAADTDTFAAGDRLDVRVTTDGSWAPTTADVEAFIHTD